MAGPRGVGRRDRRHAVRDPMVVDERGIAGVRQRERPERGAVQRITEVLSKSAKGRRIAAEEAEVKAA